MDDLPVLRGSRIVLRGGRAADAAVLHRIRTEPCVARWWGAADPEATIAAELRGESEEVVFVIVVDGDVAGSIQYVEENEPDYRHASIDIYLSTRFHGQGLGREAVKPGDRLRMTWQPDDWAAPATLQLTLSPTDSGKTALTVHLEKLPDAASREACASAGAPRWTG